MLNTKEQVRELLDRLPDDCSIEDVQYQLYVADTIRRRLEMAKSAPLIPQDQAETRLQKWLIK
ncbi:MAG TPA: hypothetical protein VJZ71_04350 [Phycisphaerae bacterium]|nr:hypothetical protein [Phycisphaerae bacterium]